MARNPPTSAALLTALSHPRLSNYKSFFATRDAAGGRLYPPEDELLGLYRWNEDVSTAFFRTISMIEVVLRNQFQSVLTASYGASWYTTLQLNSHSANKVQELLFFAPGGGRPPRRRVPAPSPDDVVSKLTFGFWPYLLDVSHDQTGQPVQWNLLIPRIIPGHRQTHESFWRRPAHQDEFFARMELCNQLRNRIAHHEPLWKLPPLIADTRRRRGAPPPAVVAPAPSNPAASVARLALLHGRLLELLGWLSPDMLSVIEGGELNARCQSLLTETALDHYRKQRPVAVLDVAQFGQRKAAKARQLLKKTLRKHQPLHLKDGSKTVGHLICHLPV